MSLPLLYAGPVSPGGVVLPTTFVEDAGIGTPLANITARNGEKGATWALLTGFTGALVESDANRFRKSGATSVAVYASGVPDTPDYDAEADFVVFTLLSGDSPSLVARQDPAANTGLRAQYVVTAGQWQFTQLAAGAGTSLGTFASVPSGTVRAKIQCRGTSAKLFLDGVERISGTTSVVAAGRIGLRNQGTVAQANATGIHLANVVGTNA